MLATKVWRQVLGCDDRTVIERVDRDEAGNVVVAHVRRRRPTKQFCGRCGQRAPGYDRGAGRRRWRALDLGTVPVFLEAEAPRVRCARHGVVVAQVPWARHDAGHTRDFDDTVAWLVTQASKTAVAGLLRVAWRSVGAIITRVVADIDGQVDRLAGLRRIGIDEVAYKRGHRYLTVVVDHDTRRLVWAAPGHDEATLNSFFALLGPQRCDAIREVSADAAPWIAKAVGTHCPHARMAADPFHVVRWASEALDEVRRQAWNEARRSQDLPSGRRARQNLQRRGNPIKRARYALWKNPEHLTHRQREQLEWIATSHPDVYRAYLLKEGLRMVFRLKGEAGKEALDRWTSWARRCRLRPFVELQRRIAKHRDAIDVALDTGLSQGLSESINTKLRLLTRLAFGFTDPEALVALAMLALGGYRPHLPGRA